MAKILIIYATSQGQTKKIAKRISDVLLTQGHTLESYDSKKKSVLRIVGNYDAVIIGASVHAGGYQRYLKKWVKSHSVELNTLPTAFFSVCLAILQKEPRIQFEMKKVIENLMQSSGWTPQTKIVFAGGLAYSKYNFLIKWWMKRISKKAGGDTDSSKDYEYTDWNKVSQFANDFSRKLGL